MLYTVVLRPQGQHWKIACIQNSSSTLTSYGLDHCFLNINVPMYSLRAMWRLWWSQIAYISHKHPDMMLMLYHDTVPRTLLLHYCIWFYITITMKLSPSLISWLDTRGCSIMVSGEDSHIIISILHSEELL